MAAEQSCVFELLVETLEEAVEHCTALRHLPQGAASDLADTLVGLVQRALTVDKNYLEYRREQLMDPRPLIGLEVSKGNSRLKSLDMAIQSRTRVSTNSRNC